MQSQRVYFPFDGVERRFVIYRPENPDGSLLMGLHGATQRGSLMARISGFPEFPEARQMTMVFPDAVDGIWRDGRIDDDKIDDVGFIEALLDHLIARDHIHRDAVCLVGASNGGFLSQRLTCELEGRFRAVATVIATMGLRVFQSCFVQSVPSLYLTAATDDPIIPFDGGTTPNSLMAGNDAPILGFVELIEHWKNLGEFERCRESDDVVSATSGETLLLRRQNCYAEDGRQLATVIVQGGGHQWFGREVGIETVRQFGRTTTEFQLSKEILDFFRSALSGSA